MGDLAQLQIVAALGVRRDGVQEQLLRRAVGELPDELPHRMEGVFEGVEILEERGLGDNIEDGWNVSGEYLSQRAGVSRLEASKLVDDAFDI